MDTDIAQQEKIGIGHIENRRADLQKLGELAAVYEQETAVHSFRVLSMYLPSDKISD